MADQSHRILIIDDDPDISEAMRIILESGGYNVASASDSQEAMECLQHHRPDLILLDVMMRMPDEGFQLSYQIKNNPKFAAIPVILITSVGQKTGFSFSPQTDEDYLPVEGFLEKPVQPEVLLDTVQKFLPQLKNTS